MHLLRRAAASLLALSAGLFACAPLTQAASVPAGFQEYHVLGNEGHVYNMFNRPVLGQAFVGYTLSGGMMSVVSATASSDNQIIYYDHWENGFEADIFAPVQANTLILGNGIAADGNACDFIPGLMCAGVDAEDVINRGDTLNLTSTTIPSGNAAAPACANNSGTAPNFGIRDCVPIPRNAADLRFDGGDRIVSSGGPISLVHVQEPTANLPGILGGAVEVLPLQAVTNATSYSVPVGQNTFTNQGGTGTAGMPFRFVDLDVVAFENNTQVQVVSPGAGTVNFTLQQGQHWSSRGAIDQVAGPALVINEGTKVSVNKPVAGLIFASSTNFYGTRTLALLPDLLHSNDYLITAPGDNTAVNGASVHDLYIYNPGINTISVTATDTLGSPPPFNIPPNSMVPYTVATGRPAIPNGSTVRLTSASNFWGISAYDSRNTSFDWGHSWLAVDFLTDTYTVPYAPDNPNRTVAPSPAAAPGSAAAGASPAFVAATENNTCVRVDFDNNGVGDMVTNGAGQPVAFSGGSCADGYLINALRTLRIYDNNAADGTLNNDISGARVRANKPVALSYGLDTDSAPTNGVGILDLGYAIYPVDQRFLNPVLTIDKTSDKSSVPTAGGIVTYSLEVRAFDFAPLNALRITDLLPNTAGGAGTCVAAAGVAPGYVCNSTTITYPNLSTVSGAAAEPTIAISGTRDELTWDTPALSPDVLQKNEVITVSYQVRIPAGPGAVLTNRAEANARLGTSSVFFTPSVRTDVVRTDVSIVKSVTDDGTPEAGEILNYTLVVTNNGVVAETNIVVSDAIPGNTQFCNNAVDPSCPMIGNDVGFAGAYSGGQNAVVWTAANLGPGQSRTLTVPVRVNPTAPAGTVIENTAGYESTQTLAFDSNTVSTTVVGPDLVIAKSALGNPDPVFPEQFVTYEVTVENVGAGTASNVFLEDIKPANATYVTGSMQWKRNAGAFFALSDASDGVEASGGDGRALDTGGSPAVDEVEFRLASLGPGEDLTFRFQVRVNTGTSGQQLANQATVASDKTVAKDTNLVQSAITDPAVRGRVFLDVDGDGIQGPGEPGIASVDVVITDGGGSFTVTTDSNGDYFVNTVQNGNVNINVDETDPNFPDGAIETTGTDGQNLNFAGTPLTAAPVGYQPSALTVTKSSGAPIAGVAPGNTISYSVLVNNTSGVNHGNVTVTDPVVPGTSFIGASTQVSAPPIRVTEYFLNTGTGQFTGTIFDLTLNQDLQPNYYVIIQGSAGDGSGNGNRGPNDNYARLTADPYGTGELAASGGANVIRLTRGAAPEDWVGVVTVVESLPNADADGFILRDVREVSHAGTSSSGSENITGTWSLARTLLMGGYNGAGCSTAESASANTKACHARIFPSGTQTINWTRDPGGATLSAATSTVMAVEWGANWTVQRVRVQGNNGGDGANAVGEYNTAAITAVNRDNTWVWGTGHTNDQGIGDASEGVLITLGNGVTQNGSESLVAVGLEDAGNAVDFEVYALTHSELAVDYRFKADGDAGSTQVDVTVDTQPFNRMALVSNGQNGTGNAYPRPMFSARYTAPGTVRLERRRSGQNFPAWVQGISFAGMDAVSAGGAQPNLASGYELPPGSSLTVTYQVLVDDPLAGNITQINNIATIDSNESVSTVDASHIDAVVRPDVSVEPNSAGIVLANVAPQTVTFAHRITNLGTSTDSFALAAFSERNLLVAPGARYSLALIDPATGVVIATDSDGDGMWNGATVPNTGSLVPGASRDFVLRVTVPGGTAIGTVDRLELRATSDLSATTTGSAFDTVTVHDGAVTGADDVLVTPDNASSVPSPPGPGPTPVAYTHMVKNLTGGSRAFQLQANSNQGYTTRIFQDTNNDGVYTPGVDVAITQTATLADGASQRVFVVIDVPAGTPAGTVDSTSLAATFFNDGGTPTDNSDDTSFGGTATDTTTVTAGTGDGDNKLGFSLSGGGTQVVAAGTTAVYPGELNNLGSAADRYAFTISASVYADGINPPPDGNQPDDGLPHASQLVLDTDGDGDIDGNDHVVAEDLDGDGIWDRIDVDGNGVFDNLGSDAGPFDLNGDGIPDLSVAGGGSSPYELRRPVDPSQGPYADPVTLTATSNASGNSDNVTATTSVQSSTLAVISEFRAYAARSGATVEWVTHSEHGTVGFHLQRLNPRNGRWVRINSRLLPALLHSRQGAVYRLRDRGTRTGRVETYRLLELEATGATLEHGPYTVQVADAPPEASTDDQASDHPSPDFERVARALDALSRERIEMKIAARHAADLTRAARTGTSVKIAVRGEGLVRLRAEPVAAALGLDPDTVRRLIARNQLELRTGDERVATLAEGDSAVLFYAEAVDSPYTDENVYWLRRSRGLRMAALNASAPAPVAIASQPFTAHAEGNRYHITHLFDDPDGDYWMWDFRFEEMILDANETQFVVPTPDVDSSTGTATVTVRLHGALEALHRVRVTLKGAADVIHESEWRGLTPHAVTFEVAASDLAQGENRIEVRGLGSGDPDRPSTFYINDMDIRYPRLDVALGGVASLDHVAGETHTVGGFAGNEVMVFDITQPKRARWMRGLTVSDGANSTQVTFAPHRKFQTSRILAIEPGAVGEPVSLVADRPSLLTRRDHSVDWLLITSADMIEAAGVLAKHRRDQGLRVMVIDIEDVYDEFAHGVRDAEAIWSMLEYAHRRWRVAPRYVVLAGEGSFDYKDYLGNGDSIIPTLLAPTGEGLFPSDNLFADVAGNDFLPEMAIGRLPVIDAAELEAVARKIIGYEASSGEWTSAAIFGADPADAGGDFAASSDRVQSAIPPGTVNVETLYLDPLTLPAAVARDVLHTRLNQGRAFVNFFGHAASGSLGNLAPGLINADDLLAPGGTLDNGANLPIVTAFTCLVGQFGFPGADGVGELLVVTADRGAAAVFSPSGLSRNILAERLGQGFYAATYGDGELVIGDAIRKAQSRYVRSGAERYVVDIYNLLGDPATIMK